MDHASKNPSIVNGILDGSSHDEFDYVLVGGGIASSVLASRLRERHPRCSILVIEAGKYASKHPLVSSPLCALLLQGSELYWSYSTVPQEHLSHCPSMKALAKLLLAALLSITVWLYPLSSLHTPLTLILERGLWTCGYSEDYDTWARLVRDLRLGYKACYRISASQSIVTTHMRISTNMALSAQLRLHLLLHMEGNTLYDIC